jgi:hypothetical protein
MSAPQENSKQQENARFNFVCHCLEGGFYMGGMAFLSPDAVLPKMVDTLGGTVAVVAMMPVLLGAAFSISQLFSAPLVERLPRLKPWVLTFGLLQRIPYLITGLLLLSGRDLRDWMLTLVVLTPVISGLIGGLGVVAWMEMVTRMIPEKQRASGWAVRYVIQALIGIAAGPVIHWILTHQEGTQGYAIMHLIAFGFLGLSYLSQVPMREHLLATESETPSKPYFSYLSSLPHLFFSTPHLVKLVIVRLTGMGYLMILGFLTKHALEVTQRPEAGNRSGGKILLTTSRVICVIVCIWASSVSSYPAFLAAFFLVGFGLFVDRVGDLTLAAELCPIERRSTLQAVLGFATGISLLIAGWFSGVIYNQTQSIAAVGLVGALLAVVSMIVLRRIPEPRHASLNQSVYSAPSVNDI